MTAIDEPQTDHAGDGVDRIYRDPSTPVTDFRFDARVADVFPDMISRSVPGYALLLDVAAHLSATALQPGDRIYDLGCSLGAGSAALLAALPDRFDCSVIAVDAAPAMLDRARRTLTDPRVRFVEADITRLALKPARLVTLHYVLQFVARDARTPLLTRIHEALLPGGSAVVSEKIRYDDPAAQARYDEAHLAFKRANGYSELEIAGKRTALERVMQIDTEAEHRQRFHDAGFRSVEVFFRCLNWVSFRVQP